MITELLKFDNNALLEYIKKCNVKNRLKILSDVQIKEKFFSDFDDYPTIWLVQFLNKNELEHFLDNDGIIYLINSKKAIHIIKSIMELDKNIISNVINNDILFNFICQNRNELKHYFDNFDYNLTKRFFDYLVNNNCGLDFISKVNQNFIFKIIMENLDIIVEKKLINSRNLVLFDNEIIDKLLNYSYFKDILFNDNFNLDELISKNFVFSDEILADERFINKICFIKDINRYRFLISDLEKNNNIIFIDKIEKQRENYYDSIINSYNNDNKMFKEYFEIYKLLFEDGVLIDQSKFFDIDIGTKIEQKYVYDINSTYFNRNMDDNKKIDTIKSIFVKMTNDKFIEMLIDIFYKDILYNFFINLNNLIKFNTDYLVISKSNYELYKKIKELYDTNSIDVDFYNKFNKNKKYYEIFYEDFLNSRRKSYELINDSLVDVNNIQGQKNNKLTKINDVDVYDFKGENFYLLIHNTSESKYEDGKIEKVFFKTRKSDGISLSLINNEKFDYFRDEEPTIVLGFNNLLIDNFVHVYFSDSFSFYIRNENDVSRKENKLYTPKSLMKNTLGYNEIVYQVRTDNNKYYKTREMVPSYLIVFDNNITSLDVEVAKKFNVPIINIDREKYKKNKKQRAENMFDTSHNYVDTFTELKNKTL